VTLCGGIAFFLWGVRLLGDCIKTLSADSLKVFLDNVTRNTFFSIMTGFIMTAIAQSLNVTSFILLNFIDSGLLSFEDGNIVLLGAGIGSTVISHLVAVKLNHYGLHLFVLAFFFPGFVQRRIPSLAFGCSVLMAVGILLYGQSLVGEGTAFLRDDPLILGLLEQIRSPYVSLVAGCAFTVLVQSSGASVGVFMKMVETDAISLRTGMILMFGANVGTVVTPFLVALQQKASAKRMAFSFLTMRGIAAVLCTPLAGIFVVVSTWLSPMKEKPAILATGFTVFNVVLAALFVPVRYQYAETVKSLIPSDRPTGKESPRTAPLPKEDTAKDTSPRYREPVSV